MLSESNGTPAARLGAREYGEHHLAVYGLTAGMAVMAVSLVLLS